MADAFDFDKALRAERRLNLTMRVLRLMAALSERSQYASMSVERMARELNATPATVRQARQKAVRLGYFHPPKGWKYHRHRSDGEEKALAFWERMQRDRRLDLVARCAFLLGDLTKKNGSVAISFAELGQKLNANYDVSRAVKRVLELDRHFRKSGGSRNVYMRIWGIYDDGPETADAPDDDAIFAHWSRRGRARQRANTD